MKNSSVESNSYFELGVAKTSFLAELRPYKVRSSTLEMRIAKPCGATESDVIKHGIVAEF